MFEPNRPRPDAARSGGLGRRFAATAVRASTGSACAAPHHRVPQVPGHDRLGSPGGPGRSSGLRQLRHPQDPGHRKLLADHPRLRMPFTPTYSSWMNQVQRLFAYITDELVGRGDHRSVQALEADIRAWVKARSRPGTTTRSPSSGPNRRGDRYLNRTTHAQCHGRGTPEGRPVLRETTGRKGNRIGR